MGLIRRDDIQYKLEEINSTIGKKYRLEHPKKERDWRTYEQEFSRRIKMAMKDLDPLVNEAVSIMRIIHGPGHPYSLTIEQRVKLLSINDGKPISVKHEPTIYSGIPLTDISDYVELPFVIDARKLLPTEKRNSLRNTEDNFSMLEQALSIYDQFLSTYDKGPSSRLCHPNFARFGFVPEEQCSDSFKVATRNFI